MSCSINLCWFRQDLRLEDNPALTEAARQGEVLPLYIYDEDNARAGAPGAASRWWLHHCLQKLHRALGRNLRIFRGKAEEIIPKLCRDYHLSRVYWNRCYEPWRIKRDTRLKKELRALGVEVQSFNGSLLWEPWEVLKKDGTPYKIFTPFYKAASTLGVSLHRRVLSSPQNICFAEGPSGEISVEELGLMPKICWYKTMEEIWTVGEEGARKALGLFLRKGLFCYKEGRDFPALECTSRLAPHLHFGEIAPWRVWSEVVLAKAGEDGEVLKSELAWRDFAYYLLYHFPEMPEHNMKPKFDNFPWENNQTWIERWQQGRTGYPLVDAGMRELWQTGFMHNRVRMVVGSFLVKNLLIHWRHGASWFWDCLVDADMASNSASWQWVAECGSDGAPYFRIFNPVTQGERYDPRGEYTRRFVPELARIPQKYLFCPWEAPSEVLSQGGVTLGKEYPWPMVDVKESRKKALEAYEIMTQN